MVSSLRFVFFSGMEVSTFMIILPDMSSNRSELKRLKYHLGTNVRKIQVTFIRKLLFQVFMSLKRK